MIRVAINGFGRIGRMTARVLLERKSVQVVAVNDLADTATLAHLFKYDSVHGGFEGEVEVKDDLVVLNGNAVVFSKEKDPENLPWKDLKIDVVIESTGLFRTRKEASKHLAAGGKKSDYFGTCKRCRYQNGSSGN